MDAYVVEEISVGSALVGAGRLNDDDSLVSQMQMHCYTNNRVTQEEAGYY
jgi:hypothetical protein